MTHFVYEAPEFEDIEDGQWVIPDTNISIQDCKDYCGYYAINADLGDAVQEIGIAKTLAEAKTKALEAVFK